MRTYLRLHVPVLLALGSGAAAAAAHQPPKAQELTNPDPIAWLEIPSEPGNSPEAPQAPYPIVINTNNARPAGSSTTPSPHFVANPAHAPVAPGSRPLGARYTNTTVPPGPTVVTFTQPSLPTEITSDSNDNANSSSSDNRSCTGCALAAQRPLTTWFDPEALYNPWTSTVVTETVVTEFITYMNNNTIDTVVTEEQTRNQTKTVMGTGNQLITHTTPTFTVQVTDGVYLQFDAGPTYVIYNNLIGGPDEYVSRYFPEYDWTQEECVMKRTSLTGWQPAQTALQDWNYFVETHTTPLPNVTTTKTKTAVPLPTQVLQYLDHDPDIHSQFLGLDLSACSVPPPALSKSFEPTTNGPNMPAAPTVQPPMAVPPPMSPSTETYISTTYETTSVHNTVRGCLRCLSGVGGHASVKVAQPTPTSGGDSDGQNLEPQPDEPGKPNTPDQPNTPSQPNSPGQPDRPNGNGANPINTPGPIPNEPGKPDQHDQDHQNLPPPVIIIGDQTLEPGQTTTVGGVPVVRPVPSGNGEAPRIIVGGSTYVYEAAPSSSPPVLTVGGGTIAANPQGEFVFGTETLKPGGAPVVVNGNTVSLGPGGIAVVNGATTTIPGLAAPAATGAPPLVIDGQTVYATQVGGSATYVIATPGQVVGAGRWVVNDGTTAYVPAAGQTVTPDGTLTVSGTAYWLPGGAPAGVVVINGVTSTISPGDIIVVNGVTSTVASGAVITPAPALTINDLTYRQTVRDGTTEYVLGDGTTLVPGSTVEIDGTTYSLDQSGTALVINGQTSTIPKLPKSNSASVTSSSVAPGTTTTTSSGRNAGDLIASGVGQTSKGAGASVQNAGIDTWVESLIIGAVGWLMMLL